MGGCAPICKRKVLKVKGPKTDENELNKTKPELCKKETIKIRNMITLHHGNKVEDNYKILSKIGKGAFGSVFKVAHLNNGMIRAMKVIKKEIIQYQDDEQKFLKEIQILKELDHPNIVKIYEYYCDDLNYFIITEFLSGGELYEKIVTCSDFSEQKAAFIMRQLLSAICYLHSKNIIHRDIKPENIIIDSSKNEQDEFFAIKLIDFGTCNYLDGNKKLTLRVGTPYYISPEVLKKNYDEKSDIWSCGVILFIILVGYPPFIGVNPKEIMEKVLIGKFDMSGKEWNRVSTGAKDLLKQMMIYDPAKRPSADKCLQHKWICKAIDESKVDKVDDNYFASILNNIKNFNAKEKLQQATIAYIVHFLHTSNDITELKKVFQNIDKSGDGRLTYSEMADGFGKVFGKCLCNSELDKIISQIDQDHDGFIEYEEFLRVAIKTSTMMSENYLKAAFDDFDTNKDGTLSVEELKKILGTSDSEYVINMIKEVDINKDGMVSYDEFKNLMNQLISDNVEGESYI